MDGNKIKKVKIEMIRFNTAIALMERKASVFQGAYWGPKETGAVRHASMDLTRALADLRRGK
jgi:hypothetical protein